MALQASKLKVGDTHSERVVENLSRTQLVMYSGASGDYNPLHSDEVYTTQAAGRSEEHTSELQSLMRISYAVFCLKKKKKKTATHKQPRCKNRDDHTIYRRTHTQIRTQIHKDKR